MPITNKNFKDIYSLQPVQPNNFSDQEAGHERLADSIDVPDEKQRLLNQLSGMLLAYVDSRVAEESDSFAEAEVDKPMHPALSSFHDQLAERDYVEQLAADRLRVSSPEDRFAEHGPISALKAIFKVKLGLKKSGSKKQVTEDPSLDQIWSILETDKPSEIRALFNSVIIQNQSTVVKSMTKGNVELHSDEFNRIIINNEDELVGLGLLMPFYEAILSQLQQEGVVKSKVIAQFRDTIDNFIAASQFVVFSDLPHNKSSFLRNATIEKSEVRNSKIPKNAVSNEANMASIATRIKFLSILRNVGTHVQRCKEDPEYRDQFIEAVLESLGKEVDANEALETEWVVLPVDKSGELDRGETKGEQSNSENGEDQERINRLHELTKQWGSSAYVVKGKLKGSGRKSPYYIAVLPQVVDGKEIVHAVADCAQVGRNGIYVLRGDKPGAASWDVVFDGEVKSRAKALGAKMIPHTKNHEFNVLSYLTAKTEDLNLPGYR